MVTNFSPKTNPGLSAPPAPGEAPPPALHRRGSALPSARSICGPQNRHKELERRLSEFLGTEDTILYGSAFDANGGLFETLLGEQDAVISASLNHASTIDGVRLCKAQRYGYQHDDMNKPEARLKEAGNARLRMVATDGVFSMDGDVAKLEQVCDLAEKYSAMVMVDDSHATGFVGKTGRGTHEHCGVMGRVDVITSTLGKALGGASGGFASGRKEIVDLLRNRSRPYLFSNSLAPSIVGASIAVFDMLSSTTELRDRLERNTRYFREKMTVAGFDIRPGEHPIVPIMLYDAKVAAEMAARMLEKGIYVIGFSFPVVPKGKARIRTQVSAAHTREDLEFALEKFAEAKVGAGL